MFLRHRQRQRQHVWQPGLGPLHQTCAPWELSLSGLRVVELPHLVGSGRLWERIGGRALRVRLTLLVHARQCVPTIGQGLEGAKSRTPHTPPCGAQ
eukprot:362322-Chlamydomonas_euryale.AAC.7